MTPKQIQTHMTRICALQKDWIASDEKKITKRILSFSTNGSFTDSQLALATLAIWMSGDHRTSRRCSLALITNIKLYRLHELISIFKKDKLTYSEIISNKISIHKAYKRVVSDRKEMKRRVTRNISKKKNDQTVIFA